MFSHITYTTLIFYLCYHLAVVTASPLTPFRHDNAQAGTQILSFKPIPLNLPPPPISFTAKANVPSSDSRRGPTRIGNKVVLDPFGMTKYPAWKPTNVVKKCDPTKWRRREFREYSERDRQKFVLALKCLRKKPSRLRNAIGSPSAYDDFVYVHCKWRWLCDWYGNVFVY